MVQCQIITADSASKLEEYVNRRLATLQSSGSNIVNVNVSMAEYMAGYSTYREFTAMILYERR